MEQDAKNSLSSFTMKRLAYWGAMLLPMVVQVCCRFIYLPKKKTLCVRINLVNCITDSEIIPSASRYTWQAVHTRVGFPNPCGQ